MHVYCRLFYSLPLLKKIKLFQSIKVNLFFILHKSVVQKRNKGIIQLRSNHNNIVLIIFSSSGPPAARCNSLSQFSQTQLVCLILSWSPPAWWQWGNELSSCESPLLPYVRHGDVLYHFHATHTLKHRT